MSARVPVLDGIGRIVGQRSGAVYHSQRHSSHYFLKHHGYGISQCVLQDLARCGVTTVVLHCSGAHGSISYQAPLADFLSSKMKHTWKTKVKGQVVSDLQRFVPCAAMKVIGTDGRPRAQAKAEPSAAQGNLFK